MICRPLTAGARLALQKAPPETDCRQPQPMLRLAAPNMARPQRLSLLRTGHSMPIGLTLARGSVQPIFSSPGAAYSNPASQSLAACAR